MSSAEDAAGAAADAAVSAPVKVSLDDSDHPLAGGGGGGLGSASPVCLPPRPAQPAAPASASASARGRRDSASDSSDDEADLRRQSNPFLRTQSHLAAAGAIPAPRPKSDWPMRTAAFWAALQHPSGAIDEAVVRRYVFDYGCPEQPAGARALLWKLLLGYLPWDRRQWSDSLARSRATYQSFVDELTNNPFAGMEAEGGSSGSAATGGAPAPSPSPTSSIKTNLRMVRLSASDDPLGGGNAKAGTAPNTWSKYYQDNSIREEIEKDVRRTYSSFHFFQERVRPLETNAEEVRKANAAEKARNAAAAAAHAAEERRLAGRGGGMPNLFPDSPTSGGSTNLFDEASLRRTTAAKDASVGVVRRELVSSSTAKRTADENHHDVIKRILFVYAKLNPGIRYVQGMNELLAPIYYVFAHSATELRRFGPDGALLSGAGDQTLAESAAGLFGTETAEADAFFCFTAVMAQMRDRFIKSLDLAPTGVLNVIANLNRLLKRIDYQLWAHLQEIGVDPRFYSFRWLTLILSQEFELPDVLRLWDSLFAAEPEASMESVDAAAVAAAAAASTTSARKPGASPPSGPVTAAAADDSSNKKLIVEFLNDCCCAILCMIRRPLLGGDFSVALKLLQSAGSGLDVQRILFKAQEIQKIRRAGGGFVDAATAKAAPPAPLSSKDMAAPFEAPRPRPGDEPMAAAKGKRELNIAMQNAMLPVAMPVAPPAADAQADAPSDVTPVPVAVPVAETAESAAPSAVASAVSAIGSTLHTVQDAVADVLAPLTHNLSI